MPRPPSFFYKNRPNFLGAFQTHKAFQIVFFNKKKELHIAPWQSDTKPQWTSHPGKLEECVCNLKENYIKFRKICKNVNRIFDRNKVS